MDFDLQLSRWPLTAVLIWIATRDERMTAQGGNDSYDGAMRGFSIRRSLASAGLGDSDDLTRQQAPDLKYAWLHLRAAMVDQNIGARGSRTLIDKLHKGLLRTEPGRDFPAEAADEYGISDGTNLSGVEQTILRPEAHFSMPVYDQWSNLSFPRIDVLRLWPRARTEKGTEPSRADLAALKEATFLAICNEPNQVPREERAPTVMKQRRNRTPVRLNKVKTGLLELHSNALPEGTLEKKTLISRLKKEKGIVATPSTFDRAVAEIREEQGSRLK